MIRFLQGIKLFDELVIVARYAWSGLLNTAVSFIVIFLAMAFGLTPFLANIAGYILGVVLSFVLSRKFVFRVSGRLTGQIIRYSLCSLSAFLCNLFTLWVMLIEGSLNPYIAQFLAACVYIVLMYIFSRYFVFGIARN